MLKTLITIVTACSIMTACTVQNEHYYRTNPQALQKALGDCPDKHPAQINCADLQQIAQDTSKLVYELQVSGQQFGKKILSLQDKLINIQSQLSKKPNDQQLIEQLNYIKKELQARLAIVKWLLSPKGNA